MGEDLETRFTEWREDTDRIARERAKEAAKVNPWSVFIAVVITLALTAGVSALSVYCSNKKQQDKQKIESLNNALLNGSDILNQKQR